MNIEIREKHVQVDDVDLELSYDIETCERDCTLVHRHPGGFIVGYLTKDDSPDAAQCTALEDPADSGWVVGHRLRSGWGGGNVRYARAMGLDAETGERVGKPMRYVLPMSLYRHGGDVWALGDGRNFPDFRWDVSSRAGAIAPMPDTLKWLRRLADADLLMASGCVFKLAAPDRLLTVTTDAGESHTWKVVCGTEESPDRIAPIIAAVPGLTARIRKRFGLPKPKREELEAAIETAVYRTAKVVVEGLNDFLSGNVFGVIIEHFDAAGTPLDSEQHAVWGYLGQESAQDELKSEFMYTVNRLPVPA